MIKFNDWKLAEYIETKDDVIGILEAALEDNSAEHLLSVIGSIAQSKGMSQIAQELKLKRDENMSFASIVEMLSAPGFQFSIQQRKAS
ncbi:MAG: hypothetical protein LBT89_03415 [Planctomycetaceae bacterium]|jgi:probable addiction module antidote protein|nr:hypothetical protein [Planctomycetaceae bacterium]